MTVKAPARPGDQDDLQALIEEARRRARSRRRRNGLALAVVALVAGGSYALTARVADHGAKGPRRSSSPTVADRTSAAGRFWYTRSVSLTHEWVPAGGVTIDRRGYTHRHGPEVLFDVRLIEETWVGIDATMRDRVTAAARFASPRGRTAWTAWGRPQPNFNSWLGRDSIVSGGDRFPPQLWYPWGEGLGPYGLDLGDSLLSYRQLLSLSTKPSAALGQITRAEQELIRRENQTGANTGFGTLPGGIGELTDIGGLLASPIPPSTRRTVLGAALRLPGAAINAHAHDALGRAGVAVTASAGIARQRLIFSPATGALLQGPKGVVVAQGRVNSAYALPPGIGPIRPDGGPVEPATLTISPLVGNPRTAFALTLTSARGRRSHKAPALDWTVAGTPGPQCFAHGARRPLLASSTVGRAGVSTYLYRLLPPTTRLHAWCPGRYELQVLPDYSGRRWRAPPNTGATPTFSAGAGSSVYFHVS
jgi:hypothetical protein